MTGTDIPREWVKAAHAEIRSALRGRDVNIPEFWIKAIADALTPLIREQLAKDAEPELCRHNTGDYYYGYDCELPKGHDGMHEYTLCWDS